MGSTQLYRHFDSDGALLYVGISLRAMARLSQHENSPWFRSIANMTIEKFDTREQALIAERDAIRQESPKFNTAHMVEKGCTMTANQYRAALDGLGLTQAGAAEFLGIGIRTSHGYANGEPIPEPIAKLFRLMIRLGLSPAEVK